MADFYLQFCDPNSKKDIIEIPFTLTGTDVSWKWLEHLYKAIYLDKQTAKNDRWYGWDVNRDTSEKICDRLNNHLEIARKYHPEEFKDICASPNMCQEDFNKMHKYFEIFRGELDNPHEFFKNGTDEFKRAVEQFNIDIHLFENLQSGGIGANFNFSYKFENFEELTYEDKKLFEVNLKDNTIYLEFNMRGKTLYDMYSDDDDYVGLDNVRRYKWIGPDFCLNIRGWSEQKRNNRLKDIDEWWNRKHNLLSSLGYTKGDPNNTFGWIPLATAEIDNIKDLIEPRQFLKGSRFW